MCCRNHKNVLGKYFFVKNLYLNLNLNPALHKKMKFSVKDFFIRTNTQLANVFTFTKEVLNCFPIINL